MVFYASSYPVSLHSALLLFNEKKKIYDSNHYDQYNGDPLRYRYIITASSVEAVDEWYRAVKDANCEVHRKAPDFYTHDWQWTLYDRRLIKDQELTENVKITLVNDAANNGRGEWSWPGQFAPDHTSGKAYEPFSPFS